MAITALDAPVGTATQSTKQLRNWRTAETGAAARSFFPKPRNVDEYLRSRQNRQQAQQQHFRQQIDHLAGRAPVQQTLEII
jgi:hypothetical protein